MSLFKEIIPINAFHYITNLNILFASLARRRQGSPFFMTRLYDKCLLWSNYWFKKCVVQYILTNSYLKIGFLSDNLVGKNELPYLLHVDFHKKAKTLWLICIVSTFVNNVTWRGTQTLCLKCCAYSEIKLGTFNCFVPPQTSKEVLYVPTKRRFMFILWVYTKDYICAFLKIMMIKLCKGICAFFIPF